MTEEAGFELDEMQEIIEDFMVEADELIASLDANLIALESAPNDLDLLNEIFRAAHTIKGTSSFLGFEQITSVTHKLEDILNKLRKQEMVVTHDMMDLLLDGVDVLKVLLERVRQNDQSPMDIDDIIDRLIRVCDLPQDDQAKAEVQVESEEGAESSADKPKPEAEQKKASAVKPVTAASDQTIRVDISRLDALMEMMGELVLSRNSLLKSINDINEEKDNTVVAERLSQSAASVNQITTELQLAVMKMRMQPIGKVFSKFPRLIRDLSRELGKEIELQISGETTELDRSVIEEVGDPLVHIIRNSADHGIEAPEDREKVGKPRKGTISLAAAQEGSDIVIQISDDGKGLNREAIRKKAVERGLTTQDELDRMDDQEVFRFVFEAGFSTAAQVSDVSGRGVGMDVVRSNIEKLNGRVDLYSEEGKGTTLSIKLPLTLAIIQGLLIESDEEVFVLPLSSVHETVRTDNAKIYYVNQKPVLRLRDEVIPLVNLNRIIRDDTNAFQLAETPYIVVVGFAERKLGITIDRFLGQEEVVIKSIGDYFGSINGIAGATILGDGRIRLIVDIMGLFTLAAQGNGAR